MLALKGALDRAQVQAQVHEEEIQAQVLRLKGALDRAQVQALDRTLDWTQVQAQVQALEGTLDWTRAAVREWNEMLTLLWTRVGGRNSSATQKNTIITLLSRFLCERARTEWVGDLCERRATWREQELSSWMIHIRTAGVARQLLVAQLRCMAYDRVFARYWGKPL